MASHKTASNNNTIASHYGGLCIRLHKPDLFSHCPPCIRLRLAGYKSRGRGERSEPKKRGAEPHNVSLGSRTLTTRAFTSIFLPLVKW